MADTPLTVFLIVTRHLEARLTVKERRVVTPDAPGSAFSVAAIDELLELGDEDLGKWVRRELQSGRAHIEEPPK